MTRMLTIVGVVAAAGLFGWAVPLPRLFGALQMLNVALSIMIAAIFVRLNRGMPTLEWRSLDPDERKRLTTAVLQLAVEYGWIVGLNATVLLGLTALSVIGKEAAAMWPDWAQRVAAAVVGALGTLCVARMAYVIWRDIDVVRLQKKLIDDLAAREAGNHEAALADEKITRIKAAGIRSVEMKPPKAWGE